MELTESKKKRIDAMAFEVLLEQWRNTPSGNPWREGETGKYWGERMAKMRDANPGGAVADSKDIGWDGP